MNYVYKKYQCYEPHTQFYSCQYLIRIIK